MIEKTIQIGGRKVAYKEYFKEPSAHINNTAKPLFLLHGWGGSTESWDSLASEVLERLGKDAEKWRLIALDFPGFGKSEEPASGWEVGDYTKWFEHFVASIYKEEKLSGDYDLIVHSFGGRVLLKLFAENFRHDLKEARPGKLVIVAGAGIKRPQSLRVRVAALAARVGKGLMNLPGLKRLAPLAQKVLYKALRTYDYEKSSGVMRETFLKVIKEDLQDSIEEIKNPTLILWGARDSYVPVKDAYLMQEKIAGSQLHVIAEGKHGIHRTHAKLLAGWIADFLRK